MAAALLARVKPERKAIGPILAFSGREYVHYEWRPVPEGFEDEAKVHDYLETKTEAAVAKAEAKAAEAAAPAGEPEAETVAAEEAPIEEAPKKRGRKKAEEGAE